MLTGLNVISSGDTKPMLPCTSAEPSWSSAYHRNLELSPYIVSSWTYVEYVEAQRQHRSHQHICSDKHLDQLTDTEVEATCPVFPQPSL